MFKYVIAFDFDGTISEDTSAFLNAMRVFVGYGWEVIVVTGRMETTSPEDLDFLKEFGYKVYFTNHKAKRKFMRDLGIEVNVWVDDVPEAMIEDWHGAPRTFRDGRVVVPDLS